MYLLTTLSVCQSLPPFLSSSLLCRWRNTCPRYVFRNTNQFTRRSGLTQGGRHITRCGQRHHSRTRVLTKTTHFVKSGIIERRRVQLLFCAIAGFVLSLFTSPNRPTGFLAPPTRSRPNSVAERGFFKTLVIFCMPLVPVPPWGVEL